MFDGLIKKGKEALIKTKEGINEKVKTYNLQKEEWDSLVSTNHTITLSEKITIKNENASEGRIKKVKDLSPSATGDKAKQIASLLSLSEVFLDVCYVKEACTNKEYFFVISDLGMYITDLKLCNKYDFNQIKVIKNVMPGMLSSNLNINNVAFVVEGSKKDTERFINIFTDENYRKEEIEKSKKYLQGINPVEEYINKYYRGITIGENKSIVLHGANENILISANDIVSVDALLDNSVAYTKGVHLTSALTSSQSSCYKMSLRFNLNNGKYIVEILPPSVLNKAYISSDQEYINSYAFCKQIINRIYNILLGGK